MPGKSIKSAPGRGRKLPDALAEGYGEDVSAGYVPCRACKL